MPERRPRCEAALDLAAAMRVDLTTTVIEVGDELPGGICEGGLGNPDVGGWEVENRKEEECD